MDLLCDTLMLEEILPRLDPKPLLSLRAASRRYNALVLNPGFAARYWQRAGVFLRHLVRPAELRPCFLIGPAPAPAAATEPSPFSGADLSFVPGPTAREKEYQRLVRDDVEDGAVVIMHSSAGLLLCSRGRFSPVHFYVCNPVTWQWVALPELPWAPKEWQIGLLKVGTDDNGQEGGITVAALRFFKVVLLNQPTHWKKLGGCLDLKIFSSDTGRWEEMQLLLPPLIQEIIQRIGVFEQKPVLGPSGTVYWILHNVDDDQAVMYSSDSHSVKFLPLPPCLLHGDWDRVIEERLDGPLWYAQSNRSAFEVWKYLQTEEGNRTWMLVHRFRIRELLKRNPEAAADFMSDESLKATRRSPVRTLGFHPTNDDVVFLGIARIVAACSMQNGTMILQGTYDSYLSDYLEYSHIYPYVHPPNPVLIPPIKSSIPAPLVSSHC
ncbi:unnamed protein product [Urochloa humidicola]